MRMCKPYTDGMLDNAVHIKVLECNSLATQSKLVVWWYMCHYGYTYYQCTNEV